MTVPVTRRALHVWLGVFVGSTLIAACSPVVRTIVNGSAGGSSSSTSVTGSSSGHVASSSGTGGSTSSTSSTGGAGGGAISTACNDGGGCPGGFICETPTACKTACTVDADCASAADFCAVATATCVEKNPSGATCAADGQCQSGSCLTNCCGVSCGTDPVCGAMMCDTSGACLFGDAGTTCGMDSCSAAMLTTPGSCDGAGNCTTPPPTLCPGNVVCADSVSCLTTCGNNDAAGDANCQPGFFCEGPTADCQPLLAAGSGCNRGSQCASGTCVAQACQSLGDASAD